MVLIIYRKISIISPGLIFVQKAILLVLLSRELIIGRNFAFQNWLGLTIKTAKNITKTAYNSSTDSPWAYIWEGLLSEGFLRLRFGGGGVNFYKGGAYYRNLTVSCLFTEIFTTMILMEGWYFTTLNFCDKHFYDLKKKKSEICTCNKLVVCQQKTV